MDQKWITCVWKHTGYCPELLAVFFSLQYQSMCWHLGEAVTFADVRQTPAQQCCPREVVGMGVTGIQWAVVDWKKGIFGSSIMWVRWLWDLLIESSCNCVLASGWFMSDLFTGLLPADLTTALAAAESCCWCSQRHCSQLVKAVWSGWWLLHSKKPKNKTVKSPCFPLCYFVFPPKRVTVAFQFPTDKKILLLRFLSISAVAAAS